MRFSFEERLRTLRTPPVISNYFSGEGQADIMPTATLARYQFEALKAVDRTLYKLGRPNALDVDAPLLALKPLV